MGKHVIFLGAGASLSSGYPLAEKLRLIVSSEAQIQTYISKKMTGMSPQRLDDLKKWASGRDKAIKFFRQGGFGTVDEFSFLARKAHPEYVHHMKQIVGVLLALHNPEQPFEGKSGMTTGFESSDYYPFIQRLFREKEDLRDDVVILSYNYDPYFEFLLSTAYTTRKEACGKRVTEPTELTSGFGDRDSKSIQEGNGFCFLKLHGTAVLPSQALDNTCSNDFLSFLQVFWTREKWLKDQNAQLFGLNPCPAMYFPWDLIDEKGHFISKEQFSELEVHAIGNQTFQHLKKTIYSLCKAIWERAQREIAEAEKISFIGLSLHEFLKPGLQFLFAKRVARGIGYPFEVVTACPESIPIGVSDAAVPTPNGHVDRLYKIFQEMYSGAIPFKGRPPGKFGVGNVACYDTFRSFIRNEL